jgi:hypothetical protein
MDAAGALAIVVGVGIIVVGALAGIGYFLRKKSGAEFFRTAFLSSCSIS